MNYVKSKVVDVARIMGWTMRLKMTRMRRKSLHILEVGRHYELLDQ